MRRQAFPPVFTHELEPGAACEHAVKVDYPFDNTLPLSDNLTSAINYVAANQSTIAAERAATSSCRSVRSVGRRGCRPTSA